MIALRAAITATLWLVNGADHTAGALTNFTNRITIADNQINNTATGYEILDDGGVNHLIAGNNFNSGAVQYRAGNVSGLSLLNNEFEGAANYPVWITDSTVAGAYVGTPNAVAIHGNTIGGGTVSDKNLAYQGASAIGGAVTGDENWSPGTAWFNATHETYDPNDPNSDPTQKNIFGKALDLITFGVL